MCSAVKRVSVSVTLLDPKGTLLIMGVERMSELEDEEECCETLSSEHSTATAQLNS